MKPIPLRLMADVLKNYPNAPKQEMKFTGMSGDWPKWCWMPMAASYAIITDGAPTAIARDMLADNGGTKWLNALSAILAWRRTKTIYRFDAELAEELLSQPLEGDLPDDLLLRLPEWGVWIEAPGVPGFFAWLEFDAHTQGAELRILFVEYKGREPMMSVLPIMLGGGTLKDATSRLMASAMQRTETDEEREMTLSYQQMHGTDNIYEAAQGIINLVLYLCSAEPDIAHYRPATRRSSNAPPPPAAKTWDVGVRIGSAIRSHKNAVARAERETKGQGGERAGHASPRPHIRAAHWHRYRIGEGRKEMAIKWIAPTLIGAQIDRDELPAVVRLVKK